MAKQVSLALCVCVNVVDLKETVFLFSSHPTITLMEAIRDI